MSNLVVTPRTTPHRRADRVSHDGDEVAAVVDESLVAHVGFVEAGLPVVIPINVWRVGDYLYFHTSPVSRLGHVMASGAQLCVTITLVDGLVLARSAMSHSVNYRSVMVFGAAEAVTDAAEKARVLNILVDHVVPGRAALVRAPDDKELAVTAVFRLPLAEGSLKSRQGPPKDRPDDLARPVAAGVVPLQVVRGALEPSPGAPVPAV